MDWKISFVCEFVMSTFRSLIAPKGRKKINHQLNMINQPINQSISCNKGPSIKYVNSRDVNKDLTPKDKDLTPKDKDKDLTPKDQDKDKGLLDLTPQGEGQGQGTDPQGPGQGQGLEKSP